MYDIHIRICTIFHVRRIFGDFFFFLFFVFSGSRGGWVVFFFFATYVYVTSLGSKIRRRIEIDIDDGLVGVVFCILWLVAKGQVGMVG